MCFTNISANDTTDCFIQVYDFITSIPAITELNFSNKYLRLWINQIKFSPTNTLATNSQEDNAAGQTFHQKYYDVNEAQGIIAICFLK